MSALYTCHIKAKVVHRDIKPENLMLNNEGDLVVVDFGEAHLFKEENDILSTKLRNNGSPLYKSPEFYRTKIRDRIIRGRQADIWAAGITLYELATGIHPFEAGQDRFLLAKNLTTTEVDYSMFDGN